MPKLLESGAQDSRDRDRAAGEDLVGRDRSGAHARSSTRSGATYRVDPDRVYVTGLSAGGSGTWALLAQEPERFAAAIPICGAGSRAGIKRLVDLPIWVFHGAKDPVQPVEESTRLVEAIKSQGGTRVKLTVYPDAEHDAWTRTYDDPAVWEWLFAQRRSRR